MSLVGESPLEPVAIYTPQVAFEKQTERDKYCVFKGPSMVNQITVTPTGSDKSTSGEVTFDVNISDKRTNCLDKCMFIRTKAVITVSSGVVADTGAIVSTTVINNNNFNDRFALRSPLYGLNTISYELDNVGKTVSLADWYPYIQYYNFFEDQLETYETTFPCMLDNTVLFDISDTNNVLSFANKRSYDGIAPRGSFKITKITNSVITSTVDNNVPVRGTATIEVEMTCPLNLSPFLSTADPKAEDLGFVNISKFQLKLNFLSNQLVNRCVSSNVLTSGSGITITKTGTAPTTSDATIALTASTIGVTSLTVDNLVFTDLKLLANIYSMPSLVIPDPVVNYSWNEIKQYSNVTSGLSASAATVNKADMSITPGTGTLNFNNIQLSSCPNKVFIFAVPVEVSGASYLPNVPEYSRGFFTMPITNISMTFGNSPSLLSTVQPELLYQYSLQNGMKYINYSDTGLGGSQLLKFNTTNNTSANSVVQSALYKIPSGYPLCLSFCSGQIPSSGNDVIAPGLPMSSNFSFTVKVNNYFPTAVDFKVIVVIVNEGILTLSDNDSHYQTINILSQQDVVTADANGIYTDNEIPQVYNYSGGNPFSKLKKFARFGLKQLKSKSLRNAIKEGLKFADTLGVPGVEQIGKVVDLADKYIPATGAGAYVAGRRLPTGSQGSAMVAGQMITPGDIREMSKAQAPGRRFKY